MDFPVKNTGVGCYFLLKDLLEPGIESASPALAGGFSTTEPPGNPKNINEENSKIQMKKASSPSLTPGLKIYLY